MQLSDVAFSTDGLNNPRRMRRSHHTRGSNAHSLSKNNNSEMQVRHGCPLMTISLWDLRHLKWDFYVLKQEGSSNGTIFLQMHPFPAGRLGNTSHNDPSCRQQAVFISHLRFIRLSLGTSDYLQTLITSHLIGPWCPDVGGGWNRTGWTHTFHFVLLTRAPLSHL